MSDSPAPVRFVQSLVAWVQQTRPARVFSLYQSRGGPLMAGGMSYSSLFASFAGLWSLFSVIGVVLARNATLWDTLIAYLSQSVPGLIDTGEGGAISTATLDSVPSTLSWTGIIAFVSLLFTMMGWLGGARTGVRAMFGRTPLPQQPLLGQLRDLAVIAGFGILVVISAFASAVSSRLGRAVAGALGFDERSVVGSVLVIGGAILVSLILDVAILIVIFRVLAQITVPLRRMLPVALTGGAATTLLKFAGGALIGAGSNPLLTGFATIVGLLIWFNLLSQVILFSAAWLAVVLSDRASEHPLGFWGRHHLPEALADEATDLTPQPVHVPDADIETADSDVAPQPDADEAAADPSQSSSRRGRDDTAK